MPIPIPKRYTLDLSGVNVNNLVSGDVYTLVTKNVRCIAPKYGPYFTESVKVYDHITQQLLTKDIDYTCLDVVGLPTAQAGKEICSILAIINKNVSNQVRLDYQAVGGNYERSYEAIKLLIDNLTEDARPVYWPNIVNRPSDFDPTMHLHSIGDTIGFEYLVSILEQLRNTLLLGDQIDHSQILEYIDYNQAILVQLIQDAQNASTVVALSRATDAKNTALLALAEANAASVVVDSTNTDVLNALNNSNALVQTIETTEQQINYLYDQYTNLFNLQSVANLNFIPSTNQEYNAIFPLGESIGLVGSDYYAITRTGKVICGVDTDTIPATINDDLVFRIKLETFKIVNSGLAQLKLTIRSFDQRENDLTGLYAKDCTLELFPIDFKSVSNDLVSVYAVNASYVQSEAPVDSIERGLSYKVNGVDSAYIDMKVEPNVALGIASRIGNYLLDHRADWNVVDYGNVNIRRGISLKINPGTELVFTFNLKSNALVDIRKLVALSFTSDMKVVSDTLSGSMVQTIVKNKPDGGKVRSISSVF